MRRKSLRKKLITIIIITVLFSATYGGLYFAPLKNLSIHVNLSSPVSKEERNPSETVVPVYNTLNIWDISWFNWTINDPKQYKQKYYFIDSLVVMTATGGRDTDSNEYLSFDSKGNMIFDFTPLKRMVDWLSNASITPIFVIGNTPKALTEKNIIDYGAFGANTAPPKNDTLYYYYITNLTTFLLRYAGEEFISKWTWRIYTEPDNEDWLEGTLENYYGIYTNSARAIREILPHAKLELGNMMEKELDSEHVNFIKRLASEARDVFPNVIGWSVYGNIKKDLFMKEDFEWIKQWQEFIASLGITDVEFVIEEGQILTDEEGRRLWLGDSTELGAAFTANAFTQCLLYNITRYTTWNYYSCEIRTPKLNVIDMFRKMEGEKIKEIEFNYPWSVINEEKRIVYGMASQGENKSHVLLYSLSRERDSTQLINVLTEIENIPQTQNHIQVYLINKEHSNFHKDWDPFCLENNITYCEVEGYGEGSPYDVALGMVICENQRDLYYKWSWEHRLTYYGLESVVNESISSLLGKKDLISETHFSMSIKDLNLETSNNNENYSITIELSMVANTVVLIEFY